ncbi:MAG: hypothetical protein AAF614_02485 [Chloroflexota bacterium]
MFPNREPDNLTFISDFPYQIIDQPTVWIPMLQWRAVSGPCRRRNGRFANE